MQPNHHDYSINISCIFLFFSVIVPLHFHPRKTSQPSNMLLLWCRVGCFSVSHWHSFLVWWWRPMGTLPACGHHLRRDEAGHTVNDAWSPCRRSTGPKQTPRSHLHNGDWHWQGRWRDSSSEHQRPQPSPPPHWTNVKEENNFAQWVCPSSTFTMSEASPMVHTS